MTGGGSGIQGYSWLCEFKATWAKKERGGGMGKEVRKGRERTNWSKLFIVSFRVHVFEHLKNQPGEHFSQTLVIQSTLSSRSPVTSLCHAESWCPLSEAHLPRSLSACFSWSLKCIEVDKFVFSFLALLSEARKQCKSNVPYTLLMKHQSFYPEVWLGSMVAVYRVTQGARSQPQLWSVGAVQLYYDNRANGRLRI